MSFRKTTEEWCRIRERLEWPRKRCQYFDGSGGHRCKRNSIPGRFFCNQHLGKLEIGDAK